MSQTLIKHGSEAGYREHLKKGDMCDRCRNGHRQFDRQYSKTFKNAGIKYSRYEPLDHLYKPGQTRTPPVAVKSRAVPSDGASGRIGPEEATQPVGETEQPSTGTEQGSLGQRLSDALGAFTLKAEPKYLETEEIPDYLHPLDPDPEPGAGDWSEVKEETFTVTADGMRLIEENMGTYLSVIGMTLEMLDPYCGPILADNLDNMVKRWSKVIARYPAAAKLFMAKGGGMLMDWIGAIQATWPVLFAIYEHHLAKTIITEKGRVMRVTNSNGSRPDIDATLPPQPQYDYTTQ